MEKKENYKHYQKIHLSADNMNLNDTNTIPPIHYGTFFDAPTAKPLKTYIIQF